MSNADRPHSADHFVSPQRPERALQESYPPYQKQLSPLDQSPLSSHSAPFSQSSNASLESHDFLQAIGTEFPNLDEHEACLMRYFVVELAPWVCI